MHIDSEGRYIGEGENATFNILKHLTGLKEKSLKKWFEIGIYRQVPILWVLSKDQIQDLSEEHKKGSIDIFIITETQKIAVRVQGKGHGEKLKGIIKAKKDAVQLRMLKENCQVVDILRRECKQVFKERVTNEAIKEIENSFTTYHVELPGIVSYA